MATTSWVKSVEEIRKIEDVLAAPAFLQGRTLTVSYLTRAEIIRDIIPPPLEPAGDPIVSVEHVAPGLVAHLRRAGGRADDVGEEHGGESPLTARNRRAADHELDPASIRSRQLGMIQHKWSSPGNCSYRAPGMCSAR